MTTPATPALLCLDCRAPMTAQPPHLGTSVHVCPACGRRAVAVEGGRVVVWQESVTARDIRRGVTSKVTG